MEVRVLQPAEWDVLKQAPDGWVPDPQWVSAIVGLKDGELRSRMVLCLMPHIEGTWIHADERSGTLGYRMEKALEEQAQHMGVSKILAYCGPEHETYMERLGFKKAEVTVWEKDLCQ